MSVSDMKNVNYERDESKRKKERKTENGNMCVWNTNCVLVCGVFQMPNRPILHLHVITHVRALSYTHRFT